jgi:hypothetical protein
MVKRAAGTELCLGLQIVTRKGRVHLSQGRPPPRMPTPVEPGEGTVAGPQRALASRATTHGDGAWKRRLRS